MNNYIGSIDTDMAIGSILSNFETPWVMSTINDSLNMKFRPFEQPMPNFPDILNRQFNSIIASTPDYKEKVEDVRRETNKEIISAICSYYGLNFIINPDSLTSVELYSITRTLYDIFVSRFTDYMIDFYITYIMNNIDPIYAYLQNDENVRKVKEKDLGGTTYIDSKFLLIHANLNKVILNMINYDIPLNELLKYFLDAPVYNRIIQCIQDTGNIYRSHYTVYLEDNRYMAQLLTCIKLKLQYKTQQAFDIGAALQHQASNLSIENQDNIDDEE